MLATELLDWRSTAGHRFHSHGISTYHVDLTGHANRDLHYAWLGEKKLDVTSPELVKSKQPLVTKNSTLAGVRSMHGPRAECVGSSRLFVPKLLFCPGYYVSYGLVHVAPVAMAVAILR